MTDDPVYYQPPAEHDQHVRKLVWFLLAFFCVLVVVAVGLILNAQWLASKLPFSTEQRFVQPVETLFAALSDGPRSSEALGVERYLQNLADDLAGHMGVPIDYEITVHYASSDEVNAFATLGGHLIVLRGLLDELPDENSLSMVLAHEIAHIKHRDPVASLGRGVAIQMIYTFLTGNNAGADMAAFGGNLGLMHFTRRQETAADRAALAALQAKYGHVGGSETLFRMLVESDEANENPIPDWLSTHPDLEARIQALATQADAKGWRQGNTLPLPARIRRAAEKGRPAATTP